MNNTRRPFIILAVGVSLSAGLALAVSWAARPPEPSTAFLLLFAAAIISENYAVLMPGYSFSIVYPLTMAAVVLCGPTPALIIAGFTSASLSDWRAREWATITYNFGQLSLSAFLTSWAYLLLGGRVLIESGMPLALSEFPRMLAPLLAAAVVSVIANVILASIGVAAKQGQRLGSVLEFVIQVFWGQMSLGVAGFVIAQVMALEPRAFVLFIFPLLIARQFYQRFTALQSAYTDTIRSLVGALEAKDPYTRGHSERVAEYSVMLARQAGLEGRALVAIENAALLHDLGKLALSGALLRKVEKLDDADWAAIRMHPSRGAEMVRKIPAVAALASSVEMHHERLDGSGYPHALSGTTITREARILAIADSYDAMTSDRPYRAGLSPEQAFQELRRCAEHELDSGLVDGFIAAIEDSGAASTLAVEPSPVFGSD